MAADEGHDLNYKMSKKIAQLTKVIYQLNCRNEDNDSVVRSVSDRYEHEISDIMSDARQKITTLRDQLSSKNDAAKLEVIVKELTAKHQKEKDEASRLFDEYKATAARSEGNARQKYEERLLAASREVSTAKDQFQAALETIKAKQRDAIANGNSEVDKLRALKDGEMDALVREYNDRYKTMMSEQMDAQDKLERDLNAAWQAKLDALRSSLEGDKAALTSQLQEREVTAKDLHRRLGDAEGESLSLKTRVSELEESLTQYRQREATLAAGSTELAAEAERTGEMMRSMRGKITHLEERLQTSEDGLRAAQTALEQANQTIAKQTTALTHTENEVSILTAANAKLQEALDAERRQRSEQSLTGDAHAKSLADRLAATEARLSGCESQLATSQARVAQLTSSVESLGNETERLRRSHQEAMDALIASHREELRSLSANASTASSSLDARHQKEMAELRASLLADHSNAMASKDAAIESLKEEHAKALEALKASHARSVEDLSAAHARTLKALQEDVADLQRRLATDATSTQQELESLAAKVRALEVQLATAAEDHSRALSEQIRRHAEAMQKTLADHSSQSSGELSAVTSKYEGELGALRLAMSEAQHSAESMIKALRSEHEQFVAALKQQHADELAANVRSLSTDANARHDAEVARIRRELTDQMERMRAGHERAMSDKIRELTDAMQTAAHLAAQRIGSLEAELLALRNSSTASEAAAGTELSALRERLAQDAAASAALLAKTVADLKSQALSAEEEASARHAKVVGELESALSDLRAQHESELTSLGDGARSAQRDMEENYKGRIASLEKRKDEERARLLADAKAAYEKELTGLRTRLEGEVKALTEANARLSTEITALSSSNNNMNQLLDTAGRELAETKSQLAYAGEENVRQSKQHVAAMAEQRRALEVDRNQAIASVHAQHQADMERAMASFEDERNEFNNKIKQLRRHIADLEYKYANRESRAEDVEKINAMLRDLREKDDALMKAYSDMKFYKLELVNREESYNKVFGRQPTVAPADTAKPVAPASAPPQKFGADNGRGRTKSMK